MKTVKTKMVVEVEYVPVEDGLDGGPVEVMRGPYTGKIGYNDDDEGQYAIVYFDSPMYLDGRGRMAACYRIPRKSLRVVVLTEADAHRPGLSKRLFKFFKDCEYLKK